MTATDELRRLLDERGVEYEVEREGKLSEAVLWDGPIGTKHSAFVSNENPDKATGEILYATLFLTPEQAIAATLGDTDATAERRGDAGTCRDEGDPGDFCCSECGVRMFTDTSDTYTMIASDGRTIIEHPNFCPNCGRRVER